MDKDSLLSGDRKTDISPAEDTAASDTVSARRRKLIRASAAAVPAIVTLRSGAVAATSFMNCVEKDASAPAADALAATEDTWVRKMADYKTNLQLSLNNSGWGSAANYLIVGGNYYLDNTDSYTLVYSSTDTVYEKVGPHTTVTQVWVLCYIKFNTDGSVASMTYYPGEPLVNEAQVTNSCMCSVNPDYSLT